MIKINQKYLKKIIKEERDKVFDEENIPWSEKSVASEIERAKEIDRDKEERDIQGDETYKPFDEELDELRQMLYDTAQETVIYYQNKEPEGATKEEARNLVIDVLKGVVENFIEDLHHDSLEDVLKVQYGEKDLMEEKEVKISQAQLTKIIQEEIARLMGEEELNEEDKDWIQDAEKDIERRGTEGVCTGDKFGSDSCPPGSKRYNLAKTFRKMSKKRKDK